MGLKTRARAWVNDQIKRLLPKGEFTRGVATLMGGTALGQGIAVLGSPVLTRLYTPDDFGVLALYSSLLGILSVVACWRYEIAIPLPEQDEDAINLVALSLVILVSMGLLISLGIGFWGSQVVQKANVPTLRSYLWLLPVGMVLVGTYEVLNYWAVRKQAFVRIAHTKLGQGIGSVASQICLGLLEVGPLGLIVGRIVGQALGVGTLATLLRGIDQKTRSAIDIGRICGMAKRYRKFPLFSSGAALLNALGLQIPIFLLSVFYGTEVVGQFSLVQRVFGIPLSLVVTSVSQVYLSFAAVDVRNNIYNLRKLFFSTARKLCLVGTIPTVILIATGPSIFTFIFGVQWRTAGVFAQIMAVVFFSEFVAGPLSYTFSVVERQDLSLMWNVSRLLLSGGSIYIAYRLEWSPIYAIVAYSLGMSIGYASLFFLSARAIHSRTQLQIQRRP